MTERKLKIFTWHIHGSYLYYLSQCNADIYIPVNAQKNEGYYGRGETFPFGKNLVEIDADKVKLESFDCILFQTNKNYLVDQYEILSEEQRALPAIYLEHDPPVKHATDSLHIVTDPDVLTVHVTHYNRLMWHNTAPVKVIEHGVTEGAVRFSGHLEKGIVVINNLPTRGRLLGFDLFEKVRQKVPIDLVGMGSQGVGLGEVLHPQLPEFIANYRFFFNPIRYTSLGLAVCEAMMLGIPVVGLATTELSTVIENGVNGFIHTDIDFLIDKMNLLLSDQAYAKKIGDNGRRTALARFNINRFTHDWESVFYTHANTSMHLPLYTTEIVL